MSAHPVAATTHTLELTQLAEINDALVTARQAVTAEDLQLRGAALLTPATVAVVGRTPRDRLPGYAVLTRLVPAGPPEYPYVRGHFTASPWRQGDLVVDLHTTALTLLSRRLDLHHRWGAR